MMGVDSGIDASDFDKMGGAIRVKDESIEVIEQDYDQMSLCQNSLSRRNSSCPAHPHMIKPRDPLESKKNLVWTMKSPTGVAHEAKQEISDYMGISVSHKRKRALADQFYNHLKANSSVMERAKEIQANLGTEFPCFIKTMLYSHVTYGFGMNLPKEFCYLHLPKHDTTVHLVNDSEETFIVNYIVERAAWCGGWKKFVMANKLLEGDALVFQLVKPSKFKVHIVRANGPAEVNSVLGNFVSYKERGALVDQFCDDLEAKFNGMKRAEEIQAKLAPQFPSFIKSMYPSHVTSKFDMRFPKEFCCLHLRHDTPVNLVDNRGEEYIVNFHVDRAGRWSLRGGWKSFCIANELLEGDVLVFQLVDPSIFKVYIVRANGLTKGDGALSLLNMDAHAKGQLADQSEIGSEDIGSEMSDLLVDFKEITGIDSFTIIVNGSSIESELSQYHRTKYYELCRTRNSFLHIHLLKTVNCKLAAEIISQCVNIVDAINACKFSTSLADYLTWDKTLEAFELLGMNVGFLRAKISRLLSLASKQAVDSKRFKEAKLKQSRVNDEMGTSELMLLDLKMVAKKLEIEMETLKVNAERHELMFQEEVKALWL